MDVYDFSFSTPTVEALQQADAAGVIGYVASDPAKTITADTIAAMHKAGLAVGFVHEETSSWRSWNGALAERILDNLGVPDHVALYFAADDDVPPSDFGIVARALIAQPSRRPKGIYGGKGLCATCVGAGAAQFAWGTAATSWDHGAFDGLALQQHTDSTIPNADRNQVLLPEWGQWSPSGGTDQQEEPEMLIRRESDGTICAVFGDKWIALSDPQTAANFTTAGVRQVDVDDTTFQRLFDTLGQPAGL